MLVVQDGYDDAGIGGCWSCIAGLMVQITAISIDAGVVGITGSVGGAADCCNVDGLLSVGE